MHFTAFCLWGGGVFFRSRCRWPCLSLCPVCHY